MDKEPLHLFKHNSINDRDCETVSYRNGNRYGDFPNRLVNSSVKRYRFYLLMSQFGGLEQEVRWRWTAHKLLSTHFSFYPIKKKVKK